jgi:putative transposase
MRYRRAYVTGGTYFFTVNLAERRRTLLTDHVDVLRSVMRKVKTRHPFDIDAMAVLPDHLHALWTLPKNDCDYPKSRMLIKTACRLG